MAGPGALAGAGLGATVKPKRLVKFENPITKEIETAEIDGDPTPEIMGRFIEAARRKSLSQKGSLYAPSTDAILAAGKAHPAPKMSAGVGATIQSSPEQDVGSAVMDVMSGRASLPQIGTAIQQTPAALYNQAKRNIHEAVRPAAEASAALGPKAGLLGPAASAIESSPVLQHKIAAETLRNLDPTLIPAFVAAMTSDDAGPAVKEMTTGLLQRIASGDEQAVVQLMGMVNAGMLGAAAEGIGVGGVLRGPKDIPAPPRKMAPRPMGETPTLRARPSKISMTPKSEGLARMAGVKMVPIEEGVASVGKKRPPPGFAGGTVSQETSALGGAMAGAGIPEPQRVATQAATANVFKFGREQGKPLGGANAVAKAGGKSKLSQEQAGVFYSKLQRVVEDKVPNRASAEQIRKTLEGAGVKPEEMEWTGTNRFLAGHEGPVSKQDLLDHLAEHGVTVEETVLGASVEDAYQSAKQKALAKGFSESEIQRAYGELSNQTTPQYAQYGELGEMLRPAVELHGKEGTTKFGSYTTPGGKNYRELLLRLPDARKNAAAPAIGRGDAARRLAQNQAIEVRGRDGEFVRNIQPYDDPIKLDEALAQDYTLHPYGADRNSAEVRAEAQTFRQGHFDQPNVLAHVRFDERFQPKYSEADIDAIARRIRDGLWPDRPDVRVETLGSGAADNAVRKGIISEEEAVAWAQGRAMTGSDYYKKPAPGTRILHIAEIQSDWHQKGRSGGYQQRTSDANKVIEGDGGVWLVVDEDGRTVNFGHTREEAQRWADAYNQQQVTGVPDAPFKKTWHELAMKRMLRWAAENGFDEITWDTGATQADRYDLSKQVDKLQIWHEPPDLPHDPGGWYGVRAYKGGEMVLEQKADTPSALADLVGKDLAERAVNDLAPDTEGKFQSYSGVNLKVGGEGMKGFYDKILPDFVNKHTKKWGGKVEAGEIAKGDGPPFESKALERLVEGDDELYGPPPGWEPSEQFADWTPEEAWQQEVIESASRIQGQLIEGDIGGRKPNLLEAIDAESNYGNPLIAEAIRNWLELKGDLAPRVSTSPAHRLRITPEMKAAVLNEGQPLFQGKAKGSYDPTSRVIALAKGKADVSTAIHEVGHYFHDVLKDHAEWGALIKDAYGDLSDVKGAEKFARHFENYLRTGDAPIPALKNVFQAMAEWMKQIYEKWRHGSAKSEVKAIFDKVVGQDTPEVRSLVAEFDRLQKSAEQPSGPSGPSSPRTGTKGGTAAANRSTRALRLATGLPDFEHVQKASIQSFVDEAVRSGFDQESKAMEFAKGIHEGTKRGLSKAETVGLASVVDDLAEKHARVGAEYEKTLDPAKGDELIDIVDRIAYLTEAANKAGTEWGRTGVARQVFMRADNSVAGILARRQKGAKGRKLTDKEVKAARDEATELRKLNQDQAARIADLEGQITRAAAETNLKAEAGKSGGAKPSADAKAKIDAKIADVGARLKAKWEASKPEAGARSSFFGAEIPVEVAQRVADILPELLELSRLHLSKGAITLADNTKAVVGHLKSLGIEGVDENAVAAAIAGKVKQKAADRAATAWETLKNEARNDFSKAAEERAKVAAEIEQRARETKDSFRKGERTRGMEAIKKERAEALAAEREARAAEKSFWDDVKTQEREWEKGQKAEARLTRKEDIARWRASLGGQRAGFLNRIEKLKGQLDVFAKEGFVPGRKSRLPFPDDPILQDLRIKEAALRNRIRATDQLIAENARLDSMTKFERGIVKPWMGARTLVASSDISFPLNQGAMALWSDPGSWAKGVVAGFKSLGERGYDDVMANVRADTQYEKWEAAGLFEGKANLEDIFGSDAISDAPIISHSQRAYDGGANALRLDLANAWAELAEGASGKPLQLEDYKALAKEVKTWTGQGDWLKGGAAISKPFFALRYRMAQFETAFGAPLRRTYVHGRKSGNWGPFRVLAAKYAQAYGTMGTTAAVLKLALDNLGPKDENGDPKYSLELRPTSTNFGRLVSKHGGTTVTREFLPPSVRALALLTRWVAGAKISAIGKETKTSDYTGRKLRSEIIGDWAISGLHPVLSQAYAALEAQGQKDKKHFGRSYDFTKSRFGPLPEGLVTTLVGFLPITAQTIKEIWEADGLTPTEKVIAIALAPAVPQNVQEPFKKPPPVAKNPPPPRKRDPSMIADPSKDIERLTKAAIPVP